VLNDGLAMAYGVFRPQTLYIAVPSLLSSRLATDMLLTNQARLQHTFFTEVITIKCSLINSMKIVLPLISKCQELTQ